MIKGIGTDIVNIKRFDEALAKWGEKIQKKLFTEKELKYCMAKSHPATHLAGRFAAKEALYKALGGPVKFSDMEVLNDEKGKPSMTAKGYEGINILVSISHEKEFAVGNVIVES